MSFLTAINNCPSYYQKKSSKSSSFHVHSPEKMWDLLQPILATAGITRVADITGLDWVGVPICTAIRPNSYSLSVSQGKGTTVLAAKLGAVMECLEGFVAERAPLTTRQASYNEMITDGYKVIDPLTIPRRNGSLYSPDMRFSWAKGEDLFSGREVYVPAQVVDLDFRSNYHEYEMFMRSSSGLASGGALPETLYHSLIELVERDAWTIFVDSHSLDKWHSYQCDLTTVADRSCRDLLEKIWAADLEAVIINVSLDINLHTMACFLLESPNCKRSLKQRSCYLGSGCSHNPYEAIEQAILEALQGRLTLISGSRDDITGRKYEHNFTQFIWESFGSYFTPKGVGGLDLSAVPQMGRETIGGDIEYLLGELQRVGINQAIAFDLSRPDMPFNVVRMVIPELETAFHVPEITRGKRSAHFKEVANG